MACEALDVCLHRLTVNDMLIIMRSVFNGIPSNCFPSSTGLGSSFDVDLARRVGEALGDECRAKGNP